MWLPACTLSPAVPAELTPVTVQLRWSHQAQFAGFYAADQNGYYADEGLKVTFLEGGPKVDLHQPVLNGTAQFGVAGAETLLVARANGEPLRAIATIFRHSPLVFVAPADSGICRPQDFVGQIINVPEPGQVVFHAMMAHVGIPPNQYTEVNLGSNLPPSFTGQVQVLTVYLINQVIRLRQAGETLNIIYPDDYGIHFYADTIFTTDTLIATRPDLVQGFLRATLRGWRYAVENPDKIGLMVQTYNPQADPALESAKMVASIPLINTGLEPIGWMTPEVWAGMEQTLREQGVLTQPVSIEQVYSRQFLEEIYETQQ